MLSKHVENELWWIVFPLRRQRPPVVSGNCSREVRLKRCVFEWAIKIQTHSLQSGITTPTPRCAHMDFFLKFIRGF